MELRPYQQDAVDAAYAYLRTREGNPVIVIPTAGGKTPIMSTICRDAVGRWKGRVLILAHVKELLEQTALTLAKVAPDLDIGIYSAGLKQRDTGHDVTIAGIQSAFRIADMLGRFDLALVDEAHLIPPSGEGMYRQFLADAKVVNPHLRVIGLTATPYRMSSGTICSPENFLNEVCYEISVKELITKGYLCPLRSKAGRVKANTAALHLRGGEFIAGEVESLMDTDSLVRSACEEIVERTVDRRAVLIFASGIQHGQHIQRVLAEISGQECGFVCGETTTQVRDSLLKRFKCGKLKFLCNVGVLTTGFDAPNIDCVAMLRPTNSPGLYYQMVGRGFRLCPEKDDCLVLDFGGNIVRHGPVDDLRIEPRRNGKGEAPAKECPECQAVVHAAYATCPDCGFEFPPPKREQHDPSASTAGILSGQVEKTDHPVSEVYYSVHTKRDADPGHPHSMRVEYCIGLNRYQSEWICFEHSGFARKKAEDWWRKRSAEPVPSTSEEAVALCKAGGVCDTKAITIRSVSGEKYDRITNYDLGPIEPLLGGVSECSDHGAPDYAWAGDDVPF